MSNFAITSVKWNAERSKIVMVMLHQFMEGKLNGVRYMLGLDRGVPADVHTVIEMMNVGDTFEIANYVVGDRGEKGDQVRAKDPGELESFNDEGSTEQLEMLPEILSSNPMFR